MIIYLALAILAALILAGAFLFGRGGELKTVTRPLTVGGHTFNVEVRDTALGRAQGLSGRDGLAEDAGMLFIFDAPGRYAFWMKDMKFPIDIVWIEGGKVIATTENVPPEPEKNIFTLATYRPPEPVSQVLELSAGAVARYRIRAGDEVR